MAKIVYENISDQLGACSHSINRFIGKLSSERIYFQSLKKDMIQKSDIVVVAIADSDIVGIAGLETKYFFKKNYIVLHKDYQGKSIGNELTEKIYTLAADESHIILSVINENNLKSIKLHTSQGGRLIGKKDNHVYMMTSLTRFGRFLYGISLLAFPFYRFFDKIRDINS